MNFKLLLLEAVFGLGSKKVSDLAPLAIRNKKQN